MNEKLKDTDFEEKLSRREVLRRALFSATAVGTYALIEGVRVNPPPIEVRSLPIGKNPDNILFISEPGVDPDRRGIVTIMTNGKLFYEPSDDPTEEFFKHGEHRNYIHRANSIDTINIAYNQGADFFDVDANDVGTIYGEHGYIPRVNFSLGRVGVDFPLPIVFDQNEGEVNIGTPNSYEDLVAHIARLQKNGDRPLAVSAELKRGHFTPETLDRMLDIHQRHEIPVMMYHRDPQVLEAMTTIVVAQQP